VTGSTIVYSLSLVSLARYHGRDLIHYSKKNNPLRMHDGESEGFENHEIKTKKLNREKASKNKHQRGKDYDRWSLKS